jgi:galactokinase
MTGAGWGGMTVSLVDRSIVDEFLAKMKVYYASLYQIESEEALESILFISNLSGGASYSLL